MQFYDNIKPFPKYLSPYISAVYKEGKSYMVRFKSENGVFGTLLKLGTSYKECLSEVKKIVSYEERKILESSLLELFKKDFECHNYHYHDIKVDAGILLNNKDSKAIFAPYPMGTDMGMINDEGRLQDGFCRIRLENEGLRYKNQVYYLICYDGKKMNYKQITINDAMKFL
jgi:hypothetical protein